MTIQQLRPEVAERLRQIDEAAQASSSGPVDGVIEAYLAGVDDEETRQLAHDVFAAHREFFDLIGDR